MNKRNAIIISASLVLFTMLSILFLNRKTGDNIFYVDKGILHTENWDFRDGMIKLAGEWEFYPDQLIFPQENEDVFLKYSKDVRIVQVPADWNKYQDKDSRPRRNIGTYRVRLTLPYNGDFGIKTSAMSYAYVVYINGIKVCESGRVSENPEDYIPDNQINIGIGSTKNKEMELVIHVANHMVNTGGILQYFSFGLRDQLIIDKDRNIVLEALLVSGYFILGIYFAGCFAQRRKAKYLLYFSLFSLLQGLYSTTQNGRMIELVISMPDKMVDFFSFQIHILYLSLFFFLMFIYDFFKIYVSKKIIIFLSALIVVIGPALIWIPNEGDYSVDISVFGHMLIIMAIFVISYLYIFWIMIKAVYRKAEASGYILIVAVSFSCYMGTLGMDIIFDLNVGRVMIILFLMMLLFLSFMMTYTFQVAYEQTDRLSDQLLIYDSMRDKFINKVYQELLRPLRGILDISEALFHERTLNGLQKQNILRITSEGKQILNIIEEIKEISNLQEDIDVVKQEIKIEEIIEIVDELRYLGLDKEQIQIRNNLSKNLPSVFADKTKLKRILYHLISNGVKYTREGEITISGEGKEGNLYIFLNDTGIGIDKSKWDIIFTSFYQGSYYEEENVTGLGVGLSITSNLLKLLGGEIWVVSKPGQGSKFTFTLPLFSGKSKLEEKLQDDMGKGMDSPLENPPMVTDQTDKVNTENKDRNNYTIMVVSDSELEHKFYMHLLNSMGYSVIFSFNENDTIHILENNKIDTVIVKSDLENISPIELCIAIRKQYVLVELPILILADKGRNEAQKYLSLGVNDYLKKPYETDELKARLNMLLMVRRTAIETINQELNNLQAQIMPHFLYNTLNTIIGLSYKDKDKTLEALQNLSTYFRAKLDFNGYQTIVTLEDEVELMKAYLSIEQLRYGERLEIVYDIDESISLLLPSLTLQPLVENAVCHSIKPTNKVCIQIHIFRKDGAIFISIIDNGPGMSKSKQEELLSGKHQRIGFTNVMKRIRLLKGSQLIIESLENIGTSITIKLLEETK